MTLRLARDRSLALPTLDVIAGVHLDVIAVEVISDGPFGQNEG